MAMRNPNHHSDSFREIKLDGVDFISSLPDAILHHILSYIPTKFALRTSVLSKRWKRVWYETPSISIDYNTEDHLDSINKTLSSYSALKITSFDVSISYGIGITTMHVDRCIKLAMSRNAENLTLKLECCDCSIPDFFYINPCVKHLSLTLVIGFFPDLIPNCNVSWTSLRNLSLNRCNLPDESIANILSGCSMLQSLILNVCPKIHRLDLSRSVNLTRLEIIGNHWIQGPAEIVAPHIHYLRLTNFHTLPTLVDVSSLTEANFNLSYGYSEYGFLDADFLQDMVVKMLAKLQNIHKLTIGAVVLRILSLAELRGVPFPQFKIKALTVETMLVRSVVPGIVRLLQNSPGLKKITVQTTKCKAILDEELERYLNTQGLNNERCWSRFFPTVEETSLSLNPGHVALFMELVLWNAKTLETMVLRLGGYLNATEYQNLLAMVPKEVSRNKNFRKYGQRKAIFNSFKIIP